MAGRKHRGMLKGKRPPNADKNEWKKGEARVKEISRKGVEARMAKAARFKSMREAAEALRDLPSVADPLLSNGVAAVFAMYREAQSGDAKAFMALAHIMGELVEKLDVQNLPVIRDDVPRAPDPVPPVIEAKAVDGE